MYNNNYFKVSPMNAREIALAEVHAHAAEFTWQKLVDNNGLPMYELRLNVNGMDYSLCIDAISGEVLGFMSEPLAA